MKLKYFYSLAAAAAIVTAFSASTASAGDWSGPYVGAQIGNASGTAEQPFGRVGGPLIFTQDDVHLAGQTIGGRAGYNWNPSGSSWVFGIEGDIDYGDIYGNDGQDGGDVNGLDVNWQTSVRGRAGFLAAPDILVFATAGWVYMDADATVENPPLETTSGDFSGWTYGIGAEAAFTDRLGVTIEWRHDEFNQSLFSFPVNSYDEGITPDLNYVRVGVNWHFGG